MQLVKLQLLEKLYGMLLCCSSNTIIFHWYCCWSLRLQCQCWEHNNLCDALFLQLHSQHIYTVCDSFQPIICCNATLINSYGFFQNDCSSTLKKRASLSQWRGGDKNWVLYLMCMAKAGFPPIMPNRLCSWTLLFRKFFQSRSISYSLNKWVAEYFCNTVNVWVIHRQCQEVGFPKKIAFADLVLNGHN